MKFTYKDWALAAIIVLLTIIAINTAKAAEPWPNLTGRVVDDAGKMSVEGKKKLTTLLEQEEKATGNQVVVVTVESIRGYSVSDYTQQLAAKWGIGKKKVNNGVVLLVAAKERKVRIEVGYGLESRLTDAASKRILKQNIVPLLAKGDYDTALYNGAVEVIKTINKKE